MNVPLEAKNPSPQTTLVILLGASAWPFSPEFQSSEAFANAARRVKAYFLNPQPFGLPVENLLDLFDAEKTADEMDEHIGKYLEQRLVSMRNAGNAARDLIVYFIGHGGFVGRDADLYLAIRRTRMTNPRVSGIYMLSLADTLRERARYLRRIVILDCCFAAAAFSAFQSGPDQVAMQKTLTAFLVDSKAVGFPTRGTSLLCSSSHKSPSLLLPDNSSTMFTKALLDTLVQGMPSRRSYLSLRDVKDIATDRLYGMQNAPNPLVLSPDQSEGDIADVPLFPNPGVGQVREDEEEVHARQLQEQQASPLSRVQSQPQELPPLLPNKKKGRTGLIVTIMTLVLVLVLGGGAIFATRLLSKNGNVSFSTPTATPTSVPSINGGTISPTQLYNVVTSRPVFYSSDLSQQDRAKWDRFTNADAASCDFVDGAYVARMSDLAHAEICLEHALPFSDFAFQVQMKIHTGVNSDGGGLVFRATNATDGYRLRIGLDGSYDLTNTSLEGASAAIHQGLNQENLLTVIAQGKLISLYVNKQLIAKTTSSFSDQGGIGFMAVAFSKEVYVTFTNVQVWQL